MTRNFIAAFFLVVFSTASYGVMIDFVKITCNPDKGVFRVEHYWAEEEPPHAHHGNISVVATKKLSGYYDPSYISYACMLDHGTYTLITHQDPPAERGVCAGAPEVLFSLLRTTTPLVTNEILGYSCNGYPTVDTITISENPSRKGVGVITTCSRSKDGNPKNCKKTEL